MQEVRFESLGYLRQHKLALCREHYLEWLPEQTERLIKKYEMFRREEKILVAVSGGRDSLSLWDILRGIEYIYEECPFAEGSTSNYYNGLLNRLETDKPGSKLTFYLRVLEARETGLFATPVESVPDLHPCPRCGQPTSTEDFCSFCRMIEKAKDTSNPLP
jgi:uncharacterized protein (TIGR00269 family)